MPKDVARAAQYAFQRAQWSESKLSQVIARAHVLSLQSLSLTAKT